MKIPYLLTFIFFNCVFTYCAARSASHDSLTSLFDRYHQFVLEQYPESATFNGDHRFDARLTDYSEQARNERQRQMKRFVDEAKSVSDDSIDAEDRLNKDLFISELQESIDHARFKGWMMPLNQQGGLHLDIPQLADHTRFVADSDKANYLKRLAAVPTAVDQVISSMRQGMKAKIVPTAVVMERVDAQLLKVSQMNVEDMDLYRLAMGIKNAPGSTTAEDAGVQIVDASQNPSPEGKKSEFQLELLSRVTAVKASFKKLWMFVHNEYLPVCRKDVGEWSMPDGIERYNAALKYHTSLNISSDEVYNTGLKEVERIATLMEKIKKKIGFKGSLEQFNEHLRTSEEFHFGTKEELLQGFENILGEARAHLPLLFGRIPNTPCKIKELDALRSASAPQAYYYSAPEDLSESAYFMVNTLNLPARPKYTMTALTLHEAVPGHHLQIALAQERKNLPWFRRTMSVTAFVEGWALYAERLGYDMGLYEDLYQHYGALGFEMWRACRLVVDVGIHAKKWTREEAIAYMMKHTVNSQPDIVSEVERYIAWPGQACAYKIGQLKILELRARAEGELKEKFHLSEFHDALLENGALPLPILEKKIDDWIHKQH